MHSDPAYGPAGRRPPGFRSRLTAVGYSEDRPIADNETPEGKARNRRIQFRIIGTAANTTG